MSRRVTSSEHLLLCLCRQNSESGRRGRNHSTESRNQSCGQCERTEYQTQPAGWSPHYRGQPPGVSRLQTQPAGGSPHYRGQPTTVSRLHGQVYLTYWSIDVHGHASIFNILHRKHANDVSPNQSLGQRRKPPGPPRRNPHRTETAPNCGGVDVRRTSNRGTTSL